MPSRWRRSSCMLALLGSFSLALVACDKGAGGGNGGGGGGDSGGSSAGAAGDSGSTDTETHGCPDDIQTIVEGSICYDKNLRCDAPTGCPGSGVEADCFDGVWQFNQWHTTCICPMEQPMAGAPCDHHWDGIECFYKLTIDCGEAHVSVTCQTDAAGADAWVVGDPVCL